MGVLLECCDVWFRYPDGTYALRGVSLELKSGSVVAVLGPNGCGKTTLLLVLAGLLRPCRGVVRFRGKVIWEYGREVRREIGIVFQDPDDQLFCSSVYDEIAFVLKQLDLHREDLDARVREVSKLLGIEHLLGRVPYRLSSGEKKRVALASVLVYEPTLLLLDEPTAYLSPKYIEVIEYVVRDLKRKGKCVVVATHDVDLAYELADYVYLMHDGHIIAEGEPSEVLCNENVLSICELRKPHMVEILERLERLGFIKCSSEVLSVLKGLRGAS